MDVMDATTATLKDIGDVLVVVAEEVSEIAQYAPWVAPVAALVNRAGKAIIEVRLLKSDCAAYGRLLAGTAGGIVGCRDVLRDVEAKGMTNVKTELKKLEAEVEKGVALVESCVDKSWISKYLSRGGLREDFKRAGEGLRNSFALLSVAMGATGVQLTAEVNAKMITLLAQPIFQQEEDISRQVEDMGGWEAVRGDEAKLAALEEKLPAADKAVVALIRKELSEARAAGAAPPQAAQTATGGGNFSFSARDIGGRGTTVVGYGNTVNAP